MVMVWKTHFEDSGRESITQANENIGALEPESQLHPKSHLDKDNYINHIKKVTSIKSANGKTIYNAKHPEYSPKKLGTQGLPTPTTNQNVKYVLSDELSTKLDKINSNLEVISKTVQILAQRITNNEKAITGVVEYLSQKYSTNFEQEMAPPAPTTGKQPPKHEAADEDDDEILRMR